MWEESAFELDFSQSRMLTRQTFLCNSPKSVQFVFSQKNSSFERKSPQMRYALEPLLGDGLFISDGETWKTRRRMVSPMVHVSRLGQFAPAMLEAVADVRERWAGTNGATIDVLSESATLAADIICRTLFGTRLAHNYATQIVDGFSEYQDAIGQVDIISFLGFPDWVPRWYRSAVHRSVKRIHEILDDIIASTRGKTDKEMSVIHRLLKVQDKETGAQLGDEAVRNEVAVLFMAGHETTANTLAWMWFLLSQSPEVEAKLHAELDSVLGDRTPTLADIPNLVYARAIFDETLRLYPPVPLLPREAIQEEQFGEYKIPKGSLMFVVPWLLHRHKKHWENPDAFIPERFLPDAAGKIHKYGYIPFSIGPRICAGMSFGITESLLSLATLAQAFRLRLKPGHQVNPVSRLTLRPEGGLPMTVHPRTRTQAAAAAPAQPSAAPGCPFHHG